MLWHSEVMIEIALFCVLLYSRCGLRWFEMLIGLDLAANLAQLLPYRADLREIPKLIWIAGVLVAMPFVIGAMIEAAAAERTRRNWWHVRILAFWIAAQLALISLQTMPNTMYNWKIPVNGVLLTVDAASFTAWCFLFAI